MIQNPDNFRTRYTDYIRPVSFLLSPSSSLLLIQLQTKNDHPTTSTLATIQQQTTNDMSSQQSVGGRYGDVTGQAAIAEDLSLVDAEAIREACESKFMKAESKKLERLTAR
jgi:hypothetical protein